MDVRKYVQETSTSGAKCMAGLLRTCDMGGRLTNNVQHKTRRAAVNPGRDRYVQLGPGLAWPVMQQLLRLRLRVMAGRGW